MAFVRVFDPSGTAVVGHQPLASRPGCLREISIGLLDNIKPNSDVFLDRLQELLRERYPGLTFVRAAKRMAGEPVSPADLRSLAGCQAVINGVGD
ncbi:MAG: hypothetical protein KGJ86_11205 [Chloroflexota bacterium]|nr:hypothetical protein [Chloroflexota bacterium]